MPPSNEIATILVVDDTPANLALMVEVLKPDYRTRVAINGEKALELVFGGKPPDLILLDIMMPGLNGYEVCARIKARSETQDIPIIFVSAMGEVEDETRGLDLGGVDYVTKPISPAIVKARIRTHLAVSRQARELTHLVGRLEAQAQELSELNRTLEDRVAQGVQELERMGRLKRFFSPSVVEMLLSGAGDDPLRSHRREVAAVFVDLRGFTAFTETSDPEDVMHALNQYHTAMGELVMDHGGTLEHFAGDGMMIYFNDPVEIDNPAAVAVDMALGMQRRFTVLARDWQRRGYALSMGIGVAQGFATIGAIGYEGRRDYGVIGNVTNMAARLCGEATGGQILVSQRVQGFVADKVRTELVGELNLKGFHRPVPAFEILGPVGVMVNQSVA
ncbi:MAG TPA: adenylate/guanylate cyclase domain-containing protein [Burkholderiaceae bacterium]|nr:adenylate/guanylate cyclase domain-containing protein [Burkholderiaceae bacterium]HQZ04523.1 adenylate/guanylate cyclase domain-containing protein [Burkholderiaceae bacterium]HRA61712.1 adenylate/guanylate cyclase domain-containing protein [Burkholderiaceae bacterium]